MSDPPAILKPPAPQRPERPAKPRTLQPPQEVQYEARSEVGGMAGRGCGWRSRSGAGRRSSAGFSMGAGRARPGWRSAGSAGPPRNRRTSSSRSLQAFQQHAAGFLLAFAPGTRRTCDRPTRTALRKRRRSAAMSSPGTAARPLSRAVFAAWMRARSASGGLAGPDRVRVRLGGVLQVAQQVLGAQLVQHAGDRVVVLVPVVHEHGRRTGPGTRTRRRSSGTGRRGSNRSAGSCRPRAGTSCGSSGRGRRGAGSRRRTARPR